MQSRNARQNDVHGEGNGYVREGNEMEDVNLVFQIKGVTLPERQTESTTVVDDYYLHTPKLKLQKLTGWVHHSQLHTNTRSHTPFFECQIGTRWVRTYTNQRTGLCRHTNLFRLASSTSHPISVFQIGTKQPRRIALHLRVPAEHYNQFHLIKLVHTS
jgi:hypothetical protein